MLSDFVKFDMGSNFETNTMTTSNNRRTDNITQASVRTDDLPGRKAIKAKIAIEEKLLRLKQQKEELMKQREVSLSKLQTLNHETLKSPFR